MKNALAALAITLAWANVAADTYAIPPGGLHVEDGDTLLIVIDGEEQRVQLAGIDAPEDADNPKLEKDFQRTGLAREELLSLGRSATEHLRRLTKIGGPYTLEYKPDNRDRYGRLSGDVIDVRGRSLSATLVSAGYAIVSRDGAEALHPLAAEAQRQNRGLWGLAPEATGLWAGTSAPQR